MFLFKNFLWASWVGKTQRTPASGDKFSSTPFGWWKLSPKTNSNPRFRWTESCLPCNSPCKPGAAFVKQLCENLQGKMAGGTEFSPGELLAGSDGFGFPHPHTHQPYLPTGRSPRKEFASVYPRLSAEREGFCCETTTEREP